MPNLLQASFLKSGPNADIKKITVRQKFGNHTLLTIDLDFSTRLNYTIPQERTPVYVRWGESPLGVSTFYGYVNHYQAATARTRDHVGMQIVLIGTSESLNSATTTNWTDITRSGVAREIAKRNRLRSIVHDHPFPVNTWATGNRSDMNCLQDLAKESGYKVWVDGATLYFLDPTKILNSAQTNAIPHFRNSDIRSIKITGGANAPTDNGTARRRVIYGLDHSTNQLFEASSGDSKYPTEVVYVNTNTYSDSQRLTDAATMRDNDFFTANMLVNGNAKVYPGSVISLDDGQVNRDQGGLWIVNEAVHEITPGDFTSSLVATRGSAGKPVTVLTSTIRGTTETVPAVVRDGKTWEAQLQEHVRA